MADPTYAYPVINTASYLIDYALTAVTLMIVYYCIKFFLVPEPTAEEKAEMKESGEKVTEWFKKKEKEGKSNTEKEKREHLLGPAKAFLIRAEQAAEKLKDDDLRTKNNSAVIDARSRVTTIEHSLSGVKNRLRTAKMHAKDEEKDYYDNLYNNNEVMINECTNHLHNQIPDATVADADWNTRVIEIRAAAEVIKNNSGALIKSIDKFIEKEEKNIAAISASPRGPPPYGAS